MMHASIVGCPNLTSLDAKYLRTEMTHNYSGVLEYVFPKGSKDKIQFSSDKVSLNDDNKIVLAKGYAPYYITYMYDVGDGRYIECRINTNIKKTELKQEDVVIGQEKELYYNGNSQSTGFCIKLGDYELVNNQDYYVERNSYSSSTSAGIYTVKVIGKQFFTGEIEATYQILPRDINDIDVKLSLPKETQYNPSGATPTPIITYQGTEVASWNYKLDYNNNKNLGTGIIKIKGEGNFTGVRTETFKIGQADLNAKWLYKTSGIMETYTTKPIKLGAGLIQYAMQNKFISLKEGVDYTIAYKNNTNVGTAQAVLTGKGKFKGSYTINYKITPYGIANLNKWISNLHYTGNRLNPSVTIKHGNYVLRPGIDYKITFKTNGKNVGTQEVIITGINNYDSRTNGMYFINPSIPTQLKVTKSTASSVSLSWKQVSSADGYRIYRYDTKTKRYTHIQTITNRKTTQTTITGLKDNTTTKYVISSYKNVSGATYESAYSQAISATTKMKTPAISLKTKSKSVTIAWKKISGAAGYEVVMSTKKTSGFKSIATVKGNAKISYTKSKLTKNKTYYFKVRAYKMVNGKKVYSDYSAVKSIKVK